MRKYVSKNNATVQTSYVGSPGELTVDPNTLSVRVHDGVTPGGTAISGGGGNANLGNLTVTDQTLTATQNRDIVIGGDTSYGHPYITLQTANNEGNVVVQVVSDNWISDYGNIPTNNVDNIFGSSAAIGLDGSIYTVGGDQSLPQGFLLKYDVYGNLVWQKAVDLPNAVGESIAVDASGNIWAVFSNYTDSSVNVYKFDTSGTIIGQWGIEAAPKSSYGYDIIIDSAGKVLITGHTYAIENLYANVTSAGSSGSPGTMLAAVSVFGTEVPAAGGTWTMTGTDITGTATITNVTSDGTNYSLTINQSVDFDAPGGSWTIAHNRNSDISIIKLDPASNSIAWQWNFGDSLADNGYSITVDSVNNVIVAGSIPDPLQPSFNTTMAVVKLSADGNVIFKKVISEASAYVSGQGITVDSSDNIYITGIRKTAGPGNVDQLLVVKLASNGSLVWAKTLSATNVICRGYSIAYNAADSHLYIGGIAHGAAIDSLVAKFDTTGNLVWQRLLSLTGSAVDQSFLNGQKSIAVQGDHYVLTGFYFDNNANQFTARMATSGEGLETVRGPWFYDFGYLTFNTNSALIVADLTAIPVATLFTASVTANTSGNLEYGVALNYMPSAIRGLVSDNIFSSIIKTHELTGIDELSIGSVGNVILQPGGNVHLGSHIIPTVDNVFDIGTPTQRVRTIYAGPNTIYIGNVKLSDQGGTFNAVSVVINQETGEETEVGEAGNKMGYLELTNLAINKSGLIGEIIEFVHTAYGSEVDEIDVDMSITRGEQQGIYNSAVEPGYQQYTSPANTEWNADGWSDLSDVTGRTYTTWRNAVNSNPPQSVGRELVMHDMTNNKYWAIKFTEWGENNGGSFAYTRQQINTSSHFVHTDYGSEIDEIVPGEIGITRDTSQGIYNPYDEGSWDQGYSPGGTLWNADGWADLSNITERNYTDFYNSVNGNLGNNVPGKELIMYVPSIEKYYTVKFSSWTQGGNGGGFAYDRFEINKDQVKEGIKFSDGTVQTTAYDPAKSLDNWGNWDVVQYSGHTQVTYTNPTMASVTCSPEVSQTNTNRVQISQAAYPDALLFWNSNNNPKSITVDGNTYQFNGGYYNGSSFFLDINAFINYTTSSVVQLNYPSVAGSGPVKWWDAALSPQGSQHFRGAVIEYHAYSRDAGTIIGTIWIANDDGDDHITHTEVNSGASNLSNVDLWDRSGNENEIYFKRLDNTTDTLKIQWTSRVFYGNETWD